MKLGCLLILALALCVPGCGSGQSKSDAQFQSEIVAGMHDLLLNRVRNLNQAAIDLCAAAPLAAGRGWDGQADADAIERMKGAWVGARGAWEQAEGVLAPLFHDIDASMDARYEDTVGPNLPGDDDLFDGNGVTGMHAIERILYAPDTPAGVVDRESQLPGYHPAAWPATEQQAAEFKNQLCRRFVDDSKSLVDDWLPKAIDLRFAFQGITALMDEQEEKVSLAAENVEESRYAQRTLADLRDNLSGTQSVYALFVPWLMTKPDGAAADMQVQTALARLQTTYLSVPGDAIPSPPADWNSNLPSAADQQSPFGILFVAVVQEVEPSRPGSAVDSMNRVARMLGLPEFAR
jgi:iron uptake system component EfeO